MFKVVIERADFSNREKRRIGLTYVSQVLGVKDSILRNRDGAAIVLVIDDKLRIADFREIVGDIVMKPEQGSPPGAAADRGSNAEPLSAGDNMQKYSALPPFREQLNGRNEVRVRNPNDFSVVVGVRSGLQGKDFEVSANGTASIYILDGPYDVYFVYANEPTALFQGDSFTLKGNGVEIQIVKVVGGNYGIRRVK